jgi:hypothetical protein
MNANYASVICLAKGAWAGQTAEHMFVLDLFASFSIKRKRRDTPVQLARSVVEGGERYCREK